MDCVIIGGGVAGMQAALTVRRRWPQKTVALIDGEREIGYYRTLLPQFMVRTLAERKLFFWRPDDDPELTVILGVKVLSLDRANRCLFLENKKTLNYERLIIASGGRPILPPVCPQSLCSGVFPVRSLTIARAIREWLPDHPQVVILGGGLVGVKTAIHLAHSNFSVTLIEREKQLLPQALTPEAALPIKDHLARNKINLVLESSVDDVQVESGQLKAIQAGGKWITCQTLLVAAGSTPDVDFLEESGLLREGRLPVSPALQTMDENIFAVGDAVTITSGKQATTPWTWPQAVTQGKLAAANVYEPVPRPLNCLSRVNCMDLYGLSLVVLGVPVPGAEVTAYTNKDAGIYRELFHVEGKIVGGALIGDITDAGNLHAMMNAEDDIKKQGLSLLKPRGYAFSKDSDSCIRQSRRAIRMSAGGI